uniref:Uncharacterized protein n=1 Tax=Sphaerodactylus townsendi TaxID=933632 RepID=A0ACB8FJR7_9SAUR
MLGKVGYEYVNQKCSVRSHNTDSGIHGSFRVGGHLNSPLSTPDALIPPRDGVASTHFTHLFLLGQTQSTIGSASLFSSQTQLTFDWLESSALNRSRREFSSSLGNINWNKITK